MIKQLFNIFKKDQQSIKMIKWSKKKRILVNVGSVVLILAVFISILSPFIMNAEEIKQMVSLNLGHLALMAGFYITFLLVIISALGFLYSSCYLDKNLDNYIVLPINRRDFVLAKLAFVYYNVMILTLLVALPFIILYFIFAQASFAGIISIILYYITMPIFVIAVVAALVGTLLYFVNKMKNKALARNMIYVGFFAIVFGVYMTFIFSMTSVSSSEDTLAIIASITDIINKVKLFFFYPSFASGILNDQSYLNILYMIITLVVSGALFLYFEKVYYKGSIGFNEGGKSTRRKKRKNVGLPRHSPTMWFFIREAKELFKTGTYFFNTIFGNILIVVIYLGMMGYAYFTTDISQEIFQTINEFLDVQMVIIVTLVIGTFFAFFNNGAATVFSRDAHALEFINTLPINQSRTFFGKVLFHILVEFLTLFIFMIIPMIVLQIPLYFMIVAVLTMVLIVAGTMFIPVIIDLTFPTLNWESETTLVKRSRSIWMNMIANVILMAVVFGGGALLAYFAKLDYIALAYVGIVFYIVLCIVFTIIYNKSVVRAFRKVK